MRKTIDLTIYIWLLILPVWIAGCGDSDSVPVTPPMPSATRTLTATATQTLSPTPLATATPTASATGTRTGTATFTGTPTETETAAPTETASPTATTTPTEAATATPSETPTITPTGVPLPELASSAPAAGANGISRTTWIRLDFAGDVADGSFTGFALHCDGAAHAITLSRLSTSTLVVNPAGELPGGASCSLSWSRPDGGSSLDFSTAAAGTAATVLYDRTNRRLTVPFPDDFWLTPDASTTSGSRLAIAVPTGPNNVQAIFRTLLRDTNKFDGFSPIGHLVIELSAAPDLTSLPRSAQESLDPMASIVLFNITSGSADFGRRIPFEIRPRTDTSLIGVVSHTLLLFPSIPLEQHNRYGLVASNRIVADPSRPFAASAFFEAAKDTASAGEAAAVSAVRALADEVIAVAEAAAPAIPRDDIALAVRVSIRTTDDIPNTLRSVKEQVLAAPPPSFVVTNVRADTVAGSPIAAIVEGEWQAPDWRQGDYFKRDANGLPVQTKTNTVPFILALPQAALDGPVPITMYQHGNPGSAQAEVPGSARRYLAGAGFAVTGFTDILNRELSAGLDGDEAIAAQITAIFFALIQNRRIPDAWLQTNADQIAFLRMLEGIGDLDVLPIGAPDGVPDLDASAPLTYVGISQGANHAPGLLPFAPEIRAAALVVGGARIAEVLVHQQPDLFITQLGVFYSDLTPGDTWVAVALFQALADNQDVHNYARFIYRNPFPVRGTTVRPSILLVEGLDDSLVPNNTTNSLAWALFPLPHLRPVQRLVPYLDAIDGPLSANIDAHTTAAFFQYVPVGVPGIPPSPGCTVLSAGSAREGHYCAQSAAESLHQRAVFFQSALGDDPAPTIINPYAENVRRAYDIAAPPSRELGEEAY